jgi:hypothetical protein
MVNNRNTVQGSFDSSAVIAAEFFRQSGDMDLTFSLYRVSDRHTTAPGKRASGTLPKSMNDSISLSNSDLKRAVGRMSTNVKGVWGKNFIGQPSEETATPTT